MSSLEQNFLSLLKHGLVTHGEAIAFRPYRDNSWGSVSYNEHHRHIAYAAVHWETTLEAAGLQKQDIVGVWLTGAKYEDIVQIMAICAAGFVPQLFSVVFTDQIVLALLRKSGAKALVVDPQFAANASSSGVSNFAPLSFEALDAQETAGYALPDPPAVQPQDLAFIVHSSGTTSGMPKLIPQNHTWAKATIEIKWVQFMQGYLTPAVVNSVGSLAHVGSLSAYMGAIATGDCIIQAPMGFSTNQLMKMVAEFGLNTLMLYAPFAATHIMQARERPDVLKALQSMRGVLYTGVALEPQIQDWAYEHNLPLQGFYGTSECGPMMRTTKGPGPNHHLLRPLPGLKVQFIPLDSEAEGSGAKLFEAVVPKDSPDAPHPSFFREDGLHHTNDLFERVDGDGYLYRGRADDWVKTHLALVDTKAIEDGMRLHCKDLVHDVVVVGQGLPLPVIIIETTSPVSADKAEAVKTQMVEGAKAFSDGKFVAERVEANRILLVDRDTLPRTKEKGNIQRNATAKHFERELNAIFASS